MTITHQQQLSPLPYAPPRLASKHVRLVRAADHLWRVQDAGGRILGHLRVVADPLGLRYRAERLVARHGNVSARRRLLASG